MTTFWKHFGWLFWTNTIGFSLFGGANILNLQALGMPGRIAYSCIVLSIVFGLTGQNLAALLERTLGSSWSRLEKWAVLFLTGLLLPPLIVCLLAPFLGESLRIVPFFLAAATWLLAVTLHPHFWERARSEPLPPHFFPGSIIALLLWAILVYHFVTAYYALPDLDPYYWLQKFQQDFVTDSVTPLGLHRPLFSSLAYIFFAAATIDLYAFFKYLLPISFISVLIPLGLLASRGRTLGETVLLYVTPAASSSFLLYSLASLPQSIANLLIVTGLSLIVYAALTRQHIFFLFSGGAFFGATLFHEMSLLFLLPWAGATLLIYRSRVVFGLKLHWFTVVLLLLLFVTYFGQAATTYWLFLESWANRVLQALLHLKTNLAFPATYINIDGNPVGWNDWWGVLRYYLFYFGSMASILGLWAVGIFIKHCLTRRLRLKSYQSLPESECAPTHWLLASYILLFLILAEALPRLANLALLPERALGYLAFLLVLSALFFFLYRQKPVHIFILGLALSASLLNAGGALYINSIKQFLITPNQIASAEWIRGALPINRVVFTGSHFNLLKFHSQTASVMEVNDPLFYENLRVFESALTMLPSQDKRVETEYRTWLKLLGSETRTLEESAPASDWLSIRQATDRQNKILQSFQAWQETVETSPIQRARPPVFVYYAKASEKNPYAKRPYAAIRHMTATPALIFDSFPDRFERVYALPGDEVVIWKLIQ